MFEIDIAIRAIIIIRATGIIISSLLLGLIMERFGPPALVMA